MCSKKWDNQGQGLLESPRRKAQSFNQCTLNPKLRVEGSGGSGSCGCCGRVVVVMVVVVAAAAVAVAVAGAWRGCRWMQGRGRRCGWERCAGKGALRKACRISSATTPVPTQTAERYKLTQKRLINILDYILNLKPGTLNTKSKSLPLKTLKLSILDSYTPDR